MMVMEMKMEINAEMMKKISEKKTNWINLQTPQVELNIFKLVSS